MTPPTLGVFHVCYNGVTCGALGRFFLTGKAIDAPG